MRDRLIDRQAAGVDPSEADVDVLEFQQIHCDPLSDAERQRTISIATDNDISIDGLVKSIREMAIQ